MIPYGIQRRDGGASLLSKPDRYEWQERAACIGEPISTFFPVKAGTDDVEPADYYIAARRICARCPVLEQCREWNDRVELGPPIHGMYAGETPKERSARRRAARKAAVA